MENSTVHYKSSVGWLRLVASDHALLELSFVQKGTAPSQNRNPILKNACLQLGEYFAKKRQSFDLPLELNGTHFQKSVWRALQNIPYGETCSYQDIAKATGNPRAVRAVGGANNKNPMAIIIPCHRVIGASGDLVGFGGGLKKKEFLLGLEKPALPSNLFAIAKKSASRALRI
jgi:methylated-DNA-[protein]-cysteine S-methyltransferase